jgi:glycine reductase
MTLTSPVASTVDADRDAPLSMSRLVHRVRRLEVGEHTHFADGTLTVGEAEARVAVADPALAEVGVRAASPGDSARIVNPLDIVEPRSKAGAGGMFPGFLGPPRPSRSRETHVLRGAAVTAAGYLPRNQEGIVDMSGPAADLSPYAGTHNVVLEFEPAETATWEQVEAALRRGLLRLAVRLADAATDSEPDDVEVLAPPAPPGAGSDRPRVGVVTNLQCQGAFKDVYVYGTSMANSLPTWIEPGEIEDGAVVSGQYGHPGLRNPTWMHCNHPVVAELRARHGGEADFAGVVLCPEPVDQRHKEHVSAHATALCRAAGFDAAVVTKEGAGNADTDLSLKLDMLADADITPVGIFAEMAGPDGTGPPVVSPPRRATAMISAGNYDERLWLPAVERALGSAGIGTADADATAALDVPVAQIHGSLSPLGCGRLMCREAV